MLFKGSKTRQPRARTDLDQSAVPFRCAIAFHRRSLPALAGCAILQRIGSASRGAPYIVRALAPRREALDCRAQCLRERAGGLPPPKSLADTTERRPLPRRVANLHLGLKRP